MVSLTHIMPKVTKEIRKWYADIGRKGGKALTPAKLAANRRNAKKAGRPVGSKTQKTQAK